MMSEAYLNLKIGKEKMMERHRITREKVARR